MSSGCFSRFKSILIALGGEAFNWYLGAGVYTVFDDNFQLGIPFEAGLEYRFNSIPIVLGVDYRPALEIVEETTFHGSSFGFNVRWNFGG